MTEENGRAPEEELPSDPAEEGEDGPDKGTTGEAPEDGEPEGVEKALKDTKAALTREQQEKAAMRRELDELRGQVQAITSMKAAQGESEEFKDEFGEKLRDPKFRETMTDDPDTLAETILELRAEIGSILRERDGYYKQEFERRDPKILEKRERIDELRKNPLFANLPDRVLAEMADLKPSEKKAKPELARGSMGAGRTARLTQDSEFEKRVQAFDRQMGFDRVVVPEVKK